MRDEFKWFLPMVRGANKIISAQRKLNQSKVNKLVTNKFVHLCESVSLSHLKPVSFEAELWLAANILKAIAESNRTAATNMVFVANYVVAADKAAPERIYSDKKVPFRYIKDMLTNDSVEIDDHKYLAPVLASKLASTPANNGHKDIVVLPDSIPIGTQLYRGYPYLCFA